MVKREQIPVSVYLRTEVTQEGNTNEHVFNVVGQAVKIGSSIYLRYKEPEQNGKSVPVTIKIDTTGHVQLTRTTDYKLTLGFTHQDYHLTHYRTPYGLLEINTYTSRLHLLLNEQPFSGKVEIDYQLLTGEEELGNYQLYLEFMA